MQKVRSYFGILSTFELPIELLFLIFPSRYYFSIAYMLYLALEKGFPKFKQNNLFFHFTFKAILFLKKISFDFYS